MRRSACCTCGGGAKLLARGAAADCCSAPRPRMPRASMLALNEQLLFAVRRARALQNIHSARFNKAAI